MVPRVELEVPQTVVQLAEGEGPVAEEHDEVGLRESLASPRRPTISTRSSRPTWQYRRRQQLRLHLYPSHLPL